MSLHGRITGVGAAGILCVTGCANIWSFSDLQRGTGDDATTNVTPDAPASDSTMMQDGRSDVDASDAGRPDSRAADAGIMDAPRDREPSDGACSDACPVGMGCDNGACVCQSQPNQCGSQCVDFLSDHDHCGTCTTVCATGATCSAGACKCPTAQQSECAKAGSDAGAACVDTMTDHGHCGGCNNACATTSACHGGTCTVCGTLATDKQCDGGVCVDTASDPLNCGACNHQCPTGASCVSGACPCPTGLKLCGTNPGACIDVNSGDPNNCGACGHVCSLAHASASCSGSACIVFKCTSGYTDCDLVPTNGCEVHTASDPSNCGSCGHACALAHAVPYCSGGSCAVNACDPGYMNCDGLSPNGCEVHTDTDVNNCGACGHVCPVPTGGSAVCVAGVCGGTCSTAGATACPVVNPTACVNLQADNINCGACTSPCAAGTNCVAGMCACAAPTTRCGTACVDTSVDTGNCGACGHACTMPTGGSSTCVSGGCVASCSMAGLSACPLVNPTACVNLQSDNNNCSACGQTCATPAGSSCTAGVCACPLATPTTCNAGTASAICVSLSSDPNCGSCGFNCSLMTGGTCAGGVCVAPVDAGSDAATD